MELIKENAIKEWRNFIGPTNVEKAKQEAPQSLRALFEEGVKILFMEVTLMQVLKENVLSFLIKLDMNQF